MKNYLELKSLSYAIPYAQTILEDISLELGPGEFLGILGHNGTGKTTLLDVILGNKKAIAGSISVMGENPYALKRQHKNTITYLSQDINLKGDMSIGDFLKFHSAFYPEYNKEDEKRLMEVFQLKYETRIGALSTGQQKKVQIIASFAARPKLILIDEITAVLDPETRDIFFRELLQVKEKCQATILLATNIAEDLIDRADKVLFIQSNKAVLHSPEDIPELFNIGAAA